MYRLSGSVGRGGHNAHDDVLLVQRQLSKNAHIAAGLGALRETGIADEATIAAIMAFQRSVVRLASPDGRVDPQGRTWRMLLGEQPQATGAVFVRLVAEDANYYLYSPPERVWGTPMTVQAIARVAEATRKLGFEIGIGDISFQQGGRMPPHGSHRRGVDVDIRPVRDDGQRMPCTITDPHYSREKTTQLVRVLQGQPELQLILFNDTKIEGVRFYEGHHNHLHVRFRG